MTSEKWKNIRGQEFTGEEAREASDFSEVLYNAGLEPEDAYNMFSMDNISVGKRLYFAESIPIDQATLMLILDSDERIRGVIDNRLKEERDNKNGGIIF